MKFRVIYSIENINENGELISRYFAANKKTAKRIAKKHGGEIAKLLKSEHDFVNSADVERY